MNFLVIMFIYNAFVVLKFNVTFFVKSTQIVKCKCFHTISLLRCFFDECRGELNEFFFRKIVNEIYSR